MALCLAANTAEETEAMAVERRTSAWLPYVAVGISLVAMLLGPCFGAAVAVVGNYVTKQQDAAVSVEQRRQSDEKLTIIGNRVEELVKQGNSRVQAETKLQSDMEHLQLDEQKDRRDIDENAKIMNSYGALIQGKRK